MCWKSTIIFHLKNSPYCTNLMCLYRIKLSLKYQFLNLLTLDFHYFPLLIAVEVEFSDGRQNTGNSQLWGELVVSRDRKMFRLPIKGTGQCKDGVLISQWIPLVSRQNLFIEELYLQLSAQNLIKSNTPPQVL